MNKKIDKKILKQKAILLEESLHRYSGKNKDLIIIKKSLEELIELAKIGLIEIPMDRNNVPGHYQWIHNGVAWPLDIINSYDDFREEISGGLSDNAKAFLLKRGNKV